ncbi:MAG: S1 RNA-binding domain-containing protein [Phycisphaeraceae bacterium]|nr:S1 RNA-binding domain-containing protein [Phycisphaeraceae bacterium]
MSDIHDARSATQITPEMSAEIDRALADATAPTAPGPARPAIRGPRVVQGGREHRTGTIVSVNADSGDVFLEFGPKELGLVEGTQFKASGAPPKKGDTLEVVVQRYEPTESLFICVLPGAVQKADWELLEPGQTIEARVTGVVKGGIELEVAGHRAFMPASHVSLDRIEDLSALVGEKLTCQVDKVDRRGKGNIVLSRRNLLKEEREARAAKLRDTLSIGQTLEGTVRKIMPFGVFVDLGGMDGLVHVSDLTHRRVPASEKAIGQIVSEGQRVTVQILKLDLDANRISLGMKQLEEDPFSAASDQVVEGAELTGRVKNITEFGVFVEVAAGVEGLVHISELDWKRVGHPADVVKPDEVLQVKVLKVDPDSKKISLSVKALKEAPAREPRPGAPDGKGGTPGGRPGGPGGGRGGFGGGGRGKRDRFERDTRTPEEIKKETPEFRRLKEQAKQKNKGGGLGDLGGALGEGLGSLKL